MDLMPLHMDTFRGVLHSEKMNLQIYRYLTATLLACLSPTVSLALDAVISHASGKVTIDGKPALIGAPVGAGRTVNTGNDSVAIISVAGHAVLLKLDSKTRIQLSGANKESSKTSTPIEATLQAGGVIASVKAAADKSRPAFRIRTRSAVMGVRGTRFYAALNEGKSKDVWMCVDEGKVDITDVKSGKTVPVTAGLGVHFPSGGEITEPKAYEWTKKLNWNMDPEAGKVDNVIEFKSNYEDPMLQNYD